MIIKSIKTRILTPPKDDILAVIKESVPVVQERSILVITSKIISIWQGRCVSKEQYPDKDILTINEADRFLSRDLVPGKWLIHTIKNNLFIPTAGIDESNANGYYILWPHKPKYIAKQLYFWIKKTYHIKNFGIIITDSHTIPLRRGVIGISLAHYGFYPLKDYREEKDLFGRKFIMTQANFVDGLAAAAVVVMGEGTENAPLAIITDLPFIKFSNKPVVSKKPFSSLEIEEKEDLYYPLFSNIPWQKGGGGKNFNKVDLCKISKKPTRKFII